MALERVQQSSFGERTEADLPDALHRARALLHRIATEDRTPALAEAMRAGLAALGSAPSREGADLLCELLEAPALEGWTAEDGVGLRTHATEALLKMGYPFALEVPPEALEQAVRERTGKHRRVGVTLPVAALVGALACLPVLLLGDGALGLGLFATLFGLAAVATKDFHPVPTWIASALLGTFGALEALWGLGTVGGLLNGWLLPLLGLAGGVGLLVTGGHLATKPKADELAPKTPAGS